MIGLVCFGISMWRFTPIMNQWGWEEMLLPFAFRGIAVHRAATRMCPRPIDDAGRLAHGR
jgi:hypothetical protein